ncbi:MAG: right-handed parallel beta-helix repeat-containing protein [Planctomycetota bacterium]
MNAIATGLSGLAFVLLITVTSALGDVTVRNASELVAAVENASPDTTIRLAAGRFELTKSLELSPGMTVIGSGIDATIITQAASWKPSTRTLPKGEMRPEQADASAYLIRLPNKASDITLAHLTLTGPDLHGAIFGTRNRGITLEHLRVSDVLYSGIRCYFMSDAKITDCQFIGAGGKWKRDGQPGIDGGVSGGAIFATWMSDSEISHNRITFGNADRRPGKSGNHYGIKGRGGKNIRIHHNTIGVNFSIEFPFEGNRSMEIDHNVLNGVVSIPKHGGGPSLGDDERSFHLHHNLFTTSYAIEFPRNHVEIDHNRFDFDVTKDGGNLISGFGGVASPGPAWFHNNLVSNPGRGVIWNQRAFSKLVIRNNHIITRTTITPRTEGLFGIGGGDFSDTEIANNIIECEGQARPLLRNESSYSAKIVNNRLANISDSHLLENPMTDQAIGLEQPLQFRCGVHGETTIDGWSVMTSVDE